MLYKFGEFKGVKMTDLVALMHCEIQKYFEYLWKSTIFNRMLKCVKTHYSRIITRVTVVQSFLAMMNLIQ